MGLVDRIPEYISEVITDDIELAELKKADKKDDEANKKLEPVHIKFLTDKVKCDIIIQI